MKPSNAPSARLRQACDKPRAEKRFPQLLTSAPTSAPTAASQTRYHGKDGKVMLLFSDFRPLDSARMLAGPEAEFHSIGSEQDERGFQLTNRWSERYLKVLAGGGDSTGLIEHADLNGHRTGTCAGKDGTAGAMRSRVGGGRR